MATRKSVKLVAFAIFAVLIVGAVVLAAEFYFRFQPEYGRAGFSYDPVLFYRLTPGLVAQKPYAWGKEGREPFVLRFNKQGFRGPDFKPEKPAGFKRILVLGDSYTAGLDYPDDEIFTTQLANQLNAAGQKVEVLNASCPAWGADQQYLYWRDEGKALKPDLVVLVFSPNDLREMWNKGLVRLGADGSLVVKEPVLPKEELRGWKWAARSSLYQYLQKKHYETQYGDFLRVFNFYPVNYGFRDSTDWDMPLYLSASFPALDSSYVLYERLLEEIQTDLNGWGGKIALAKIPTRYEFDESYTKAADLSPTAVETRIVELTTRANIPFLNLNQSLRADTTASPLRIFMDWEYHFDKDGHDFTAKQLTPFLTDLLK